MIHHSFTGLILVGLGGAIGSVLRFLITLALENYSRFLPWGTIAVNITGSFVIGMGAAWLLSAGKMQETIKFFLLIGLCGGFTTFSSFSLQNMQLLQEGAFGRLAVHIAISALGCLLATVVGYHLVK